MQSFDQRLAATLWRELGGAETLATGIRFSARTPPSTSVFHVWSLAAASVAAATLAAAELWALRTGTPVRGIEVDRLHASAGFRLERLASAEGWKLPPLWDPIAGDYQASDGWLRLHTNYAWHREAATAALRVPAEKTAVAAAVRARTAGDVEEAVVVNGGCAAALRSRDAWKRHAQGRAVAVEALIARSSTLLEEAPLADLQHTGTPAPLSGVRVLDLTRVIAGPVCTRFLAAYGADVLRLDPPGFAEVPVLLPETTRGKRCASVDLKTAAGRRTFDALLADAHLLVHGYRPGALEGLGYTPSRLAERNPLLVTIRVDAYGYSGPWAGRRGFDSLVQMSTGIADPGNGGPPEPLPAQALDHATGYLMAAAACRALIDGVREARVSLAGMAKLLVDLGTDCEATAGESPDLSAFMERVDTEWGPLNTVQVPGRIDGLAPVLRVIAGSLGRHPATFETA